MSLTFVAGTPFSPVVHADPTCTNVIRDYATFTSCTGTLADGRHYIFKVPTDWNGTLVIFSEGYATSESSDPPIVITQPIARWLLENGSAVAAAFGGAGWAIHETVRNQIEMLGIFVTTYGPPSRTIAYGGSLGGISSAALVQQHPESFDGAVCVAGVLGGGIATFNQALDMAFVIQQLLGPGLQVARIADPGSNLADGLEVLDSAQSTPQGRARLALAGAMNDIAGWFSPLEPAPQDYSTQEYNQFLWLRYVCADFLFGGGRVDIEARAGGNPSWNTDVNYQAQLEKSINYDEVLALYSAAGLSIDDDLAVLRAAPRISPDAAAVEYMEQNIVFNGDLHGVPVVTMHSEGDGFVVVQNESAYRQAVLRGNNGKLLRQAYVHRGGHGSLTWAEIIAGFEALFYRLDTGRWGNSMSPGALNAAAAALGPYYNRLWMGGTTNIPMAAAFTDYEPAPFPRPYDLAGPDAPPDSPAGPSTAVTDTGRQPLTAWPLPYHGGLLQVSLAPVVSDAGGDVAIYDVCGRLVRQLAATGSRTYEWDGTNAGGGTVGNGVYFLRQIGDPGGAPLKLVVVR